VFRLVLTSLSAVLAFSCFTQSSFASSHVVAHKSSHGAGLYLAAGLRPGHKYRIEVRTSGHKTFSGFLLEHVVGISGGRLFTDDPTKGLSGTTPRDFTIRQPVSGIRQWGMTLQVALRHGTGVTVRILDLGKR
jgi:hypothetical protein